MAQFGLAVERRVLSQPAEVWWAGFRSDTLRLQQQGWELAAEEDVQYGRIRLLLRHQDMRLYAFTNEVMFDYYRQHEHHGRPLVFQVVAASPKFEVRHIPDLRPGDWDKFRQIDAMPQYVESEIKCLDDFKIFAAPLARTEEIIVEPQTVSTLLEQIRKMQSPEQARIRRENARRERAAPIDITERQTFHAQIISLGDYRKAA